MRKELRELLHYLQEKSYLDQGRRVVQLSTAEMAKALGVTQRSIQRRFHRLKALGLIEIEATFLGHGGRGPNRYLLQASPLPERREPLPALLEGHALALEGKFLEIAREVWPGVTLEELLRQFKAFRQWHRMRRKPPSWWFQRWRWWLERNRPSFDVPF